MKPDTHEDEPPLSPPPPPWPFGEAQRRQAAEVAAWAVGRAHAMMIGVFVSERRAELAAWLDIATKAEALSRGWQK